MKNVVALIMASSLLSGCAVASAYWQKPTKYKGLPDASDGAGPDPAVAVLSMDASRRLVLAQKVDTIPGGRRYTCPEPPPDVANNSLAQSLARLETKAGTNLSAGSAYQIVAQILSARTSKVEIWRTSSSTYCVLMMNGWTSHADAYLAAAREVMKDANDTEMNSLLARTLINGLPAEANTGADGQEGAEEPPPGANAAPQDEELEKAKAACENVPVADKPNDADCLKVEAAKATVG